MGLITTLTKLFSFTSGSKEATQLLSEATNIADELFTSDDEKQEFHLKMERLQQISGNVFISGARASLVWAVSTVTVYYGMVRDIIAAVVGEDKMPESTVDLQDLIEMVGQIIAGSL